MAIYGPDKEPPQIFPPNEKLFIAASRLYPPGQTIPLGEGSNFIPFGPGAPGPYGVCSGLRQARNLYMADVKEREKFLEDRVKRAAEEQLAKSTQAPVVQGNVFHGAN